MGNNIITCNTFRLHSVLILAVSLVFCSVLLSTMAQADLIKASTNKFSLHLHQVLRGQATFDAEQNLFYSPSSILVALAMTHLGARGNTAKQMSSSFHLDEIPEKQLNAEFQKFLQKLNQSNAKGNEIAMANRLFVQMGFEVSKQFQEDSEKFFNAEAALVDYQKNSEGARQEVNQWVEQKTKNKIKDLIPEGMFGPDTRLTLVNAIYFKGSWMSKFDSNNTQTGPFQLTPSKTVQVPMMYKSDKFKYFENEGLKCKMLELPYSDEKISMIILLPDEVDGLSKLEDSLNYSKLDEAIGHLKMAPKEEVEVTLPKFKLSEKFSLKEVLSKMGASDLFNAAKADLTGINKDGQLYVSEVVHKAFVDVNEEGTEAAAATAVRVALMCMPMNPIFFANHPFLFLIRHNESGAILFIGRLANPK
ncbi:leukocyte elastase inhibitor-like [Actinia tenebrosa]|uniref:Leukocyte elastase inhibitor-like n=1 Tax=Actinia tenebrosa TaxID=6105 RepID=A0A6P8HXD8_ACTTE|nr:leukocyte elastase inhibitor-like [Actinia tenebrosa]